MNTQIVLRTAKNICLFLTCRNICEKLKIFNQPRYKLGLKFCRICEAAFATLKDFCECCGIRLRVTRHDKKGANPNHKRRLDRLIARAEKKRQNTRAHYKKFKADPSFRAKERARARLYYLKNAKKLIAKALERYHRKKKLVQIPVIS